ncbi:sugar-binding domain-containing protein [uncultured Allobaculum sp.]|uniref:sugar-binding domain-containing protein n=2 Tax=Allobaculum TaxID=174708 RepID=UPI00259259F8|nr:sugar-binding domain-containing protein [uncultured Allobaculum sp.]
MKNTKWLRRIGGSLLGGMMAMSSVSMQMVLPVSAEEANSDSNQMVSEPEVVPVSVIDSDKRTVNLNANWKFTLSDPANAQNSSFDDSKWDSVNLPHDYSIDQDYTPAGEAESGYKLGGVGWYRKVFTVAPDFNKRMVVEFNGVYMDCEVYINGHKLGGHPYGYTGFAFDLTDYLNKDGENVLAVRVNHQTPSSRWYSGSGIYRDVTLTITDDVHVGYDGIAVTTPNLETEKGGNVTTHAAADIVNDSSASKTITVKQTVLDGSGNAVGTASKDVTLTAGEKQNVALDVMVNNPTLWKTNLAKDEHAALYTLKTEVVESGKTVDTTETTFGYRYYSYDKDTGFSLNGEKMKFKGVCMHHDQGSLGSAAEKRAIERQVKILKEMGANAIRVTHNPADPYLLEVCSREGIMVINELFDGWIGAKNGNYNDYARFFEQTVDADNEILNKEEGDKWFEFDTRAAVQESRNEASVLMYSLGNEIFEGSYDWSAQSARLANAIMDVVEANDTGQFLTFGGNRLKSGTQEDAVANAIANRGGLIGFNYTVTSQYNSKRSQNPTWKVYGGETASHINSRGVYNVLSSGALNADNLLTSYDYSAVGWGHTASDSWYTVITNDYNGGEFVWTGFDYLGEPTPKNGVGTGFTDGNRSPKNSYFGIVDTAGLPKDNYYLYQSLWNDHETTLHVLPAWNKDVVVNNGNGDVPVVVYSDAPTVELFFTAAGSTTRQSLGKKTMTEHTTAAGYTYQMYEGSDKESTTHRNLYRTWKVPYANGKIEAVAYDKSGNPITTETVGRSSVETTGAASAIDMTADRPNIAGDGVDLSYVTIDITDSEGRIVPSAKNKVTVRVEGAGELAALDNGVQPDQQSYRDDNRKAQAGQLVAIIRSNGKAGDIKVTASADGLESKTIMLNASEVEGGGGKALSSFEYSRNYYVKKGEKPVLPSAVKANYADGTSKNVAVTWDTITDDQVAESGNFTVSGTAEGHTVSVSVYVIDQVAALLNVSTAVSKGTVPVLPESRRAVLNDGEILDASFAVDWQMPDDSAFAEAGNLVIPGTASVFGQSVPVKAFVRVANATVTLGDSISGAAHLSQNIPEDKQSDTLEAIIDGSTVKQDVSGGPNTSIWSNYDYCYTTPENNTAQITFRYDTQQAVGQIKVHFSQDSWSASYPDANTTAFEISENGTDWTPLTVKETIGDEVNNVKCYTYDFAPTRYTYLRMTVTNTTTQKPNGNNPCTAITEVEQFGFTSTLVVNQAAELDTLTIDGTAVSADLLASKEIPTSKQTAAVEAVSKGNGAVTMLPAENKKQVILVEAEDGSKISKYTILFGVMDPEDDSRDIPVEKLTAAAGSTEPNHGPERLLDNNTSTDWHSSYKGTNRDDLWAEFAIDGDYMVDGLRYLPRMTGGDNGRITKYRIDVLDENGEWKTVTTGSWAATDGWKNASFAPVKTTKVRLYAVESMSDQSYVFACGLEMRLTGEEDVVETNLDYNLLHTAIDEAGKLNASEFKSASAFTSALDAAKAIDNKASHQADIDQKADALNQAMLDLRLTPSAGKLDSLK